MLAFQLDQLCLQSEQVNGFSKVGHLYKMGGFELNQRWPTEADFAVYVDWRTDMTKLRDGSRDYGSELNSDRSTPRRQIE